MTRSRGLAALALSPLFLTLPLCAVDFSTYRGFKFGASVEASAKQAGAKLADVKQIHLRPALIQELEWRSASVYSAGVEKLDPVREGLLRFYNGELFQIITTYDRQKVEGMSVADLVAAISLTYGPTATRPAAEISYHTYYGETAPVLARWEDAEYSYNLVRTGDQASFALIMSQKHLEGLAQAAILAAVRSEALEAPQKALDLLKKQDVDARLLLDKARAVNVPNFKP